MRPGSDKHWRIYGKWNEGVWCLNEETNEEIELWRKSPLPAKSDHMYHMTNFAINLNHLPDSLKEKLPPTDTRFRPDQRALEVGETDLASSEKLRLEEKQRAARRLHAEQNTEHSAKYLKLI